MLDRLKSFDRKHLAELAVVFVLYTLTAKFGLMMYAVSSFAALIWPAAGIAVGALLVRGTVRLESVLGRGSKFIVEFPIEIIPSKAKPLPKLRSSEAEL